MSFTVGNHKQILRPLPNLGEGLKDVVSVRITVGKSSNADNDDVESVFELFGGSNQEKPLVVAVLSLQNDNLVRSPEAMA